MPRLRAYHAESNARKHIGVVGLIDTLCKAVFEDRWERTAGADHCSSFVPSQEIARGSFGSRRRIGQWKDDRLLRKLGHGSHDALRERVRLARNSDEHSQTCVARDIP